MTNTKLHDYDRAPKDSYYTIEADRLTPILHRHVSISGLVHEPAAGAGHIGAELEKIPGVTDVIETDAMPAWYAPSVWQLSIESVCGKFQPNWVVTNLPFDRQDALMAHLLRVYPQAKHAYLVRSNYLAPAKRGDVIHNNTRFAGEIKISKRPRWIEGSKGSPAVDYSWILFDREGRTAAPKLAFENGPTVDLFTAPTIHFEGAAQ